MTLEASSGNDCSLFAQAGDIALANARANQILAAPNVAPLLAAAPSGLSGPVSSLVLAASLFTPSNIAFVQVSFDFYFTDSAADTLTLVVQEVPSATAIAGGATTGTWHVENGGTAVSVTGGSPATLMTLTKTVPAGGLSAAFNANFITLASGPQIGIQLVISCTHNLSAMVLNATISAL